MKVNREQVAKNRKAILVAASRLFREKGFQAVTVAEIMKAADLTHGGFYGHFKSKDDLIAQSLAHALKPDTDPEFDFHAFIDGYLSPRHRDNIADGCPIAALASETRHQTPEACETMTKGVQARVEQMSNVLPAKDADEKRRAAIGSWAAMVGAIILARAADDSTFSDEILQQTHAWINDGLSTLPTSGLDNHQFSNTAKSEGEAI